MPEGPTYNIHWQDFRRRNRLAILLFLGYLPVVGTLGYLLSAFVTSEIPLITIAVFWTLVWLWACLRVCTFHCPRCGKLYCINKYFVATLGRRCPHCGLRRYENA